MSLHICIATMALNDLSFRDLSHVVISCLLVVPSYFFGLLLLVYLDCCCLCLPSLYFLVEAPVLVVVNLSVVRFQSISIIFNF